MADDEVEEQMEQRRRRTPPKKPRHHEPISEEAGPSKTQPPGPPVLKPRKPPVTFDQAIQTMRQQCPKSSRTPESAPSASVPSTSQAPPTAPEATSVGGGLAASSPSASGGGSAPRPSTLEAASSSTAASHVALPKRPLDFKRAATGEDWSPQSSSTESPRTPLEVRQMLGLRARQQQQSIPSTEVQSDNSAGGAPDFSSGAAREDSAATGYADDGWGFPKVKTPDCTWCIPELCGCYRKLCGKKEPKSKLITTPVPGTSPTALLYAEPTKSALRRPPPPDPDVIDVVPKVHFPDMPDSDSTPPPDPPKKSYKSDLVMFLDERHPNPPPRRVSIEYDLDEVDLFFQPRRNVCDRGVNTVFSHVGYPFLVVHPPPSPTSPGKPAPQPPEIPAEKQQEQMEVGEVDPDAGREEETME